MAAPLSMSRATVNRSDTGETLENVSILVRPGGSTAKLQSGHEVIAEEPVATVQWAIAGREAVVTLASGETWVATRARGCGCGS